MNKADSTHPSPEEQLLRLIETGGEAAAKPAPGWRPFDGQWWRQWWTQLREDFKGAAPPTTHGVGAPRWSLANVNLKLINKALAGLLALVVLYMLWDMASPKPGVKDVYAQAAAAPAGAVTRATIAPLDSVEEYAKLPAERDLFRFGPASSATTAAPTELAPAAPAVTPAKTTLDAVLQTLRIVGIAWSASPEVMVEDTQAGRTYFLKRGQAVKQLTVEQIFRDKVVFSYEGEQGELVAP